MKLPILIYNLKGESIRQNEFIDSETLCIRSFQYFGIKIIEGDAIIFSVKDANNIKEANNFETNENFHYTIFCKSQIVKLQIWNSSGETCFITLYVKETKEPEHYKDLLSNYFLPNHKQLENCIIDENKFQLTKRLLIDYKNILRYKGTIKSLEKFLNFIGFDPESIKIYSEYKTPENKKTISPDKSKDLKTGYYHLLYDNYIQDKDDMLTHKNLPKRLLNVTDVSDLFKILYEAIAIAHTYFLIPEQDISFFGINHSANGEQFLSISSNHVINHFQNPHSFNKNINIQLYKNYTPEISKFIIDKNIQKINETEISEVKYINSNQPTNDELYIVENEIIDSQIYSEDFTNFFRKFGNLLHLSILSPNTYIEYEIKHENNEFTKIHQNWVYINEQPHKIIFYSLKTGEYNITIRIKDGHNNVEEYFYKYNILQSNIDFEIYNSSELIEVNSIISDIDSPSKTTISDNPIINIENLPINLSEYYQSSLINAKYLTDNERYLPSLININRTVKETTKLPIDYMDNWIELISIPATNNLTIKYYNPEFPNKVEYLTVEELANTYHPDVLCIIELDIYLTPEDEESVKYFLITTQIPGIDILQLFEIYDNQLPIHELPDFTSVKIPVNYDFELYPIVENNYVYPTTLTKENSILIKSIYPRLVQNKYNVLIGDILVCKIDDELIVENMNMIWNVYNAFTGNLVYTTTDLALKYRIQEKTIFNIELIMSINENSHQIHKKSILSSYGIQ